MILLHNIGEKPSGPAAGNYNPLSEIIEKTNTCTDVSFDGIYLNVWENRGIFTHDIFNPILFVMGNYIGKDNKFDVGMPYEQYCNWWHLLDLVTNYHCKLGWHTWSHRNLLELSDQEVIEEITPPFPMKYFAYPYGNVDARVAKLVAQAGYEEAWSVHQGDGSQFQRRRAYL